MSEAILYMIALCDVGTFLLRCIVAYWIIRALIKYIGG